MVFFGAVCVSAQEQRTEIQGFYQTYKDFSFNAGNGYETLNIKDTRLSGGGFTIAQNLASWFAFWSQTTFYGSAESSYLKARVINNLEGIRYQTQLHGPFQLYAKAGMGFSHFSLDYLGSDLGGAYKFSVSYGAGAMVWLNDNFGLVFDASHLMMGVPNLTDASGRDKWDSGLALTTGLAVRF
jgi:hypothetical protein